MPRFCSHRYPMAGADTASRADRADPGRAGRAVSAGRIAGDGEGGLFQRSCAPRLRGSRVAGPALPALRCGAASSCASSGGSCASSRGVAARPWRRPGFHGKLRPYQRPACPGCSSCATRARRRAGRRHGPRQDGADAGAPHGRAGGGAADRPALVVLPDQPGGQLAARGGRASPRPAACCRCTARSASSASPTSPAHDLVLTTYPLLPRDRRRCSRAGLARA